MKTVWNWKNIGKTAVAVLIVGVLVSALPLQQPLGFFVGMLAGGITVLFCLTKWDLLDFE